MKERERKKKREENNLLYKLHFCSFTRKHQTQTLVVRFLIGIEKTFFHYYKRKSFLFGLFLLYIYIYIFV